MRVQLTYSRTYTHKYTHTYTHTYKHTPGAQLWRFVKGAMETTEAGVLGSGGLKIEHLNDAFSGHPKAK